MYDGNKLVTNIGIWVQWDPSGVGKAFVIDIVGSDTEFLCYVDDEPLHDAECLLTDCYDCNVAADLSCQECGSIEHITADHNIASYGEWWGI